MFRRTVLYGISAVLGIVCGLLLSAVFTIVTVTGSGMEPAFAGGSKALVYKLAYEEAGEEPEVGAVVAFHNDVYGEEGEGSILIRRVAGAPGDVVEIRDNIFYRNGRPYTDYMKEAVHLEPMEEIELGEHEIFVLSDDRKSSLDSRNEAIGVLDSRECIGEVCFP